MRTFKIVVLAAMLVVSAACGGGSSLSGPTGTAAGTPTPIVVVALGYSIANNPLGPPDGSGMPPGAQGGVPISQNPKQPLASGNIILTADLRGSAPEAYLDGYLVTGAALQRGDSLCFFSNPDPNTWAGRCTQYERPLAGPVPIMNGETKVVGYVTGLTPAGNVTVVYVARISTVKGNVDVQIAAQ